MASATPPETDTTQTLEDETQTSGQSDNPQIQALESRIEDLQGLVQRQGDASGQLGQLIQGLQGQIAQLGGTVGNTRQAEEPEPSEEFQRLYKDIPGYIREKALEASREALGPHLAHQAVQTRDSILAQAKANLDGEHGKGFWDEYMETPVMDSLKGLPLEAQASQAHIDAVLRAAVGNVYMNPEHRQEMETRRAKATKAREEAVNNLPGGRPAPARGERLDDSQRAFLDSLERNGIHFSEKEYLTAIKSGGDYESWVAAKAAAAGKKG